MNRSYFSSRMRAVASVSVSLVALALLAACAPRPHGPPSAPPPGVLVSTRDIPGDFFFRQRVSARYPGREMSFDAVLQKQGDTLTLVGLTPFGTRAFVLQQRGTDVQFTAEMPDVLPFPPRYVLLDVHRTFFMTLAPTPAPDGERTGAREGEELRERWSDGHLTQRSFRRLDGAPPGLVEVRYGDDGMEGLRPPRTIELRNGWFGYALTITTLEQRALPPPSSP